MKYKTEYYLRMMLFMMVYTFTFASCSPGKEEKEAIRFMVAIDGLNSDVNTEKPVWGRAFFAIKGNQLEIDLKAQGLEPDMMHMQHLHGFKDGSNAACPSMEEHDENGDGVVDLIETREASGITMIPLHNDPASLNIASELYPVSDSAGNLYYHMKVNFDSLQKSYTEKFGLDSLVLEDLALFIHGVSAEQTLPETAESLEGVPAHATLPVACGALEFYEKGNERVDEVQENFLPWDKPPSAPGD
jgi:hypothetical protein